MSQIITSLMQIEDLDVNELAEALEFNGYAECVGAIRTKHIDGQAFLKLTELQISLWRLPPIQARRLWSFIRQIHQDPKQFLTNNKIRTKMAPKVSTLGKSPVRQQVTDSNLNKSDIASNKPNIAAKPNISKQIHESVQKSGSKEVKSSTLNKQESKLLKNTLEELFRKDSVDTPNTSFIHAYKEKQPRLPPKPEHLRIVPSSADKYEEPPDDFNDGYLSPINVNPNQLKTALEESETERRSSITVTRSNSANNSSFLNRLRKGYENLEIRPEVIQNNYEEQNTKSAKTVQTRPLPPIPQAVKDSYAPGIEFETDDEELADYTPVLDDDNSDLRHKKVQEKYPKAHRPLPNVPLPLPSRTNTFPQQSKYHVNEDDDDDDDSELAEYTPVVEDDEINTAEQITKAISIGKQYKFRPLPAVPSVEKGRTNKPLLANSANADDEVLAEYTPVVEDESESIKGKSELFRRPLPPFRIPPSPALISISQSFAAKERPKLPTPDSEQEDLTPTLHKMSVSAKSKSPMNTLQTPPKSPTKLIKPRAELPKSPASSPKAPANLPKPPANLPKPPLDLPAPQDFRIESQANLPEFDLGEFKEILNELQSKPLPLQEPEPVHNTELQNVEDEFPFYSEIDVAREPSYRETDRKGARRLLTGLEDGAFVIRPSRQAQYICTFSIMHRTKMFNLGIERDSAGALVFGSVTLDFDQPKFYNVGEIVAYYSVHPLYLSGESILLKDILPRNRR